MTGTREVAVVGTGLFVPGFAGVTAFMAGAPDAEAQKPRAELVKPRQRRRTSLLSKALADAYAEALEASGFAPEEVGSVFGSALGEAATMIGLLDQMWGEEGTLSPMRFVTSVHNTASGVVSISTSNRGFTTSLGADYDTPAMALAEGIGLVLARGESVIVCCGDERVPGDLVPAPIRWELLGAAVALSPVGRAAPGSPRLSGLGMRTSTVAPPDLEPLLRNNPSAGLLDLIAALEDRRDGIVALDRGKGRGFTIGLCVEGR